MHPQMKARDNAELEEIEVTRIPFDRLSN